MSVAFSAFATSLIACDGGDGEKIHLLGAFRIHAWQVMDIPQLIVKSALGLTNITELIARLMKLLFNGCDCVTELAEFGFYSFE